MSKHYKDEQFQEYLDGVLPEKDTVLLEHHLTVCRECSTSLAQYKSLYQSLLKMDEPIFDPAFAQTAAKAAMKNKNNGWLSKLNEVWLVIPSIIIIVVAVLYYGGNQYLPALFGPIFQQIDQELLPGISNFINTGSMQILIVIAVAILIFTAFFDNLIIKHRHRTT